MNDATEKEAFALVDDLAEWSPYDFDRYQCVFCGSDPGSSFGQERPISAEPHEDDCLWLRATVNKAERHR